MPSSDQHHEQPPGIHTTDKLVIGDQQPNLVVEEKIKKMFLTSYKIL